MRFQYSMIVGEESGRAQRRPPAALRAEFTGNCGRIRVSTFPQIPNRVQNAMTNRAKVRAWATATGAIALAILTTSAACAQEQQPETSSVQLNGNISQSTYTDSASENCEEQNANNPFAGMDPLVCKGEMMPTAGRGVCNFPGCN